MFEQGDYVKHRSGGSRYRIVGVHQEGQDIVYRALRVEDGDQVVLFYQEELDNWEVVDPPKDVTKYQVGQVLVKKQGTKLPAFISNVYIDFSTATIYEVTELTYHAAYNRKVELTQNRLEEQYVIRKDLIWVTKHGSPTSIIRQWLNTRVTEAQAEIDRYKYWMERIHHL